jgi:verruculogen synthase
MDIYPGAPNQLLSIESKISSTSIFTIYLPIPYKLPQFNMTLQSVPSPKIQRFSADADPETVWKAVQADGVAIIEGFLSADQVAQVNKDVDPPLHELRKKEGTIKKAPDGLPSYWMADRVPECVQRVHNIVGFSKVFRHDILNHKLLHGICERAFEPSGDYWLGYGTVIDNGPKTELQPWHRDQPNYPLLRSGPDAPEGMLNFFTCLSDFTRETGVTEYMWNSNKRVEIGEVDDEHPVVWEEVKAGDTAVLSGKMVHRGSANLSDIWRRALPIMIVPGVLTPFDATCHLSREMVETMTPLAQRMVGRRSIKIPPPSRIGIWSLNMKELGQEMGLKTNQPDLSD